MGNGHDTPEQVHTVRNLLASSVMSYLKQYCPRWFEVDLPQACWRPYSCLSLSMMQSICRVQVLHKPSRPVTRGLVCTLKQMLTKRSQIPGYPITEYTLNIMSWYLNSQYAGMLLTARQAVPCMYEYAAFFPFQTHSVGWNLLLFSYGYPLTYHYCNTVCSDAFLFLEK